MARRPPSYRRRKPTIAGAPSAPRFAFFRINYAKAEPPQRVFRDAQGRTIGTAQQNGNMTTFRDSSGRTTGTATTDSAAPPPSATEAGAPPA